jgi:hypothetical protein
LEVEFRADLRFCGRKVIIAAGKCLIHVPEEVWSVWREYEMRGKAEAEK